MKSVLSLTASVPFLLTLFVPSSLAQHGVGTSPEAVDDAGDVTYHEAYPGSRDHEYLDILKAWWAFNASTDELSLTLEGKDYTSFAARPPTDYTINCYVSTTLLLQNATTGRAIFRLHNPREASQFTPFVGFAESGQGGGEMPIAFRFDSEFASPGRMEFTVSRQLLLKYGEVAQGLLVRCSEQFFPGGFPQNPILGSSPISNHDDAEGVGSLSLIQLNASAPLGINSDEFGPAGNNKTSESVSPGRSPGFGALGWLASAVIISFILRRQEPVRESEGGKVRRAIPEKIKSFGDEPHKAMKGPKPRSSPTGSRFDECPWSSLPAT